MILLTIKESSLGHNNQTIWKILITCFVSCVIGVIGWICIEVANTPKIYAEKEFVKHEIEYRINNIKESMDKRLSGIEKSQVETNRKLDKLIFHISGVSEKTYK